MATWRSALGTSGLAALVAAAACLPGGGPPIDPVVDDAGTPPPTSLGDDASTRDDLDLGPPFAVTGLQPSHGPWTGGTRTNIAGRGFSSKLVVSIGGKQLPASDVFASDPTKAAVITPAGTPGAVDVQIENVDTAQTATLPSGFIYDAFSVTPDTGSTTGGTRVMLVGSGTAWTAASTVTVGGKPCTAVAFTDATDLACSTPASAAGSQSVLVTNADGSTDEADDAFVYSDSPDGYRGGLYGGALSGTLNVLGFDQWTGVPLQGGQAIAGSSLAGAVVGTLGAAGAVQLTGAALTGKVTVTLAAKCHQPMTYVDVPVDTATFYLPPALDPACQGDPSSSGNYVPTDYGSVQGELVWPGGIEFQRAAWSSVPAPGPGERQVAYVFDAPGTPLAQFGLPNPANATTPTSGGQVGYSFALTTLPGNRTLYALAGLEQDIDEGGAIGRFEPFVMGIARGVPVLPDQSTAGIDIPMTTLLDRSLGIVPQPPPVSPGGPDRLLSTLLIDLGSGTFAPLPQGSSVSLLPVSTDVPFVGIPALDGTLAGAQYDVSATAVTGQAQSYPVSAVTGVETTDANDPLTVGGFFAIPTLVQPSTATWNGTHVQIEASGPVDLAVVDVSSGNGLVVWQIVAPGSDLSFDLPDLAQVPGVESLRHGVLTSTFAIARINGFQYGTLRSGQLTSSAWSAYAEDVSQGAY